MTALTGAMTLNLPRSMLVEAELSAAEDGVSLDQFVTLAVAEKIAMLKTARFFASRQDRANPQEMLRLLTRPGGEPPRSEDEVPSGYVPRGSAEG